MTVFFGLCVSKWETMNIISLLSGPFDSIYGNLVRRIGNERARYIDETQWRIGGRNR